MDREDRGEDRAAPPTDGGIDRRELADALRDRFGGDPGECRAVARAAADLAASGRLDADRGAPVTADVVRSELADAPGGGPGARWNWWVGSLDVAYGGYADFALPGYPVAGRDGGRPE